MPAATHASYSRTSPSADTCTHQRKPHGVRRVWVGTDQHQRLEQRQYKVQWLWQLRSTKRYCAGGWTTDSQELVTSRAVPWQGKLVPGAG
jgi:hypothetical protein